jgi:outer membrane protein TolC
MGQSNYPVLRLALAAVIYLAGFAGCSVAAAGPPAPAAQMVPTAPPVYRLTLEEARQRALANNKALALARLNIDEKGHAAAAARKDYFPKILGNVTYFRFNNPLGTVLTAGGGRLGLLPPTPVQVNVLNRNSTLSTAFVAQPITKLIAVNALVQIARADQSIAQAKLEKGTAELLSGVTQAYYGLAGVQRIQSTLEVQARLLEQLLAVKPLPELRISLVEVRQGLLQARGQVRDLTDQLNSLIDFPPCTALELVEPLPPPPPVRCADEAAQLALARNAEVREAEQNIAKAEAALRIARMDYLPDVNIVGGYANQTIASYIQDNIGYIGVTASYTFWDWGKRRDVKRQRETQIALAHQNLQVTRDKVALEARKTFGAFEQAQEAYQLDQQMVQARKEAEKKATDPGTAMTAKAATSKAELEAMQAEIAYRVAHAQLMQTLGEE